MGLYKNVASQKLAVFAWDHVANAPKTGDAGNISAQISKDAGATAATDDAAPTELDATDAKGVYIFDLLQAETNANLVIVSAVSSTANITLDPVMIHTTTVMRGTDSAATEAKQNTMDTVVDAILTDTGTDGVILKAAGLNADAANEIATALLDLADGVETDYTVRQAMRLILSALAGLLDGATTTTVHTRDPADAKNRITATVDVSGNRTAMTHDVT